MKQSRWIPLLVFVIAPMLPLWRALFQGLTIGPFDQIRSMAPWNAPSPHTPWDVLQADGVLQFYPWRDLVFSAWGKGQIPLWNSYELAGTPLLANSQSGALYPLHVISGVLHVSTPLAIVLLAWFHLSWAGLGAYKLCRSIGGTRLGGLIAGTSFCLSPFMLAWTGLASVITTVAWIPWILWLITELVAQRPVTGGRWAKQTAALAVCTGMMLLGGHLQFAFYGLLTGLLFTVTSVLITGSAQPRQGALSLLRVGTGIFLGGMLATAQVIPSLNFAKLSNRQNVASEQGYTAYVGSAIQPFELGAVMNPLALGFPRDSLSEENPEISTYWPIYLKSGANYAESAICIGPFILVLLGCVNWRDRRVWPAAFSAVVIFLLCTGTPANRLLYFGVPGWSASGSPGRSVAMFVCLVCILGGCGVRVDLPAGRRKLVAPFALLVLGAIASLYAPFLAAAADSRTSKVVEAVQAGATGPAMTILLIGFFLGLAGWALVGLNRTRHLRLLAAIVPIAFCAIGYGLTLVPTGVPLSPVKGPEESARVAYLNRSWDLFRFTKANMPPNLASVNRIHELGGYDSLMSGETVTMLSDVNGENPAPAANGNMMFIKNQNLDKLREAGVSYVGTESGYEPIPHPTGRVVLPQGSAKIVSEDYSSVTVQAQGSGQLTLKDRMLPGWTVTVDGKPASLKPGLWRSVDTGGPGPHTIIFRYDPPGFRTGLELSLLALVCVLGLTGFGYSKSVKQPLPTHI